MKPLIVIGVVLSAVATLAQWPTVAIVLPLIPAAWASWQLAQHYPRPDEERGRLQLQQLQFDRFALIDPLTDPDVPALHDSASHSLHLRLVALQESISLSNLAATQVSDLMEQIQESAALTQIASLNALFDAAKMGPEGRGYAAVSEETLRLAARGQHIANRGLRVLTALLQSTGQLNHRISQQLAIIDQHAPDCVESTYQTALALRDECLVIQQQLSELSARDRNTNKSLATLTQLMSKTRASVGSLIRYSDDVLQMLSARAG